MLRGPRNFIGKICVTFSVIIGIFCMLTLYQIKDSLVETVTSGSAPRLETPVKEIVLYYFVDPKFLGDKNHALGIVEAIKKQSLTKEVLFKGQECDVNDIAKFKEMLEKESKVTSESDTTKITIGKPIVIGIGTHGLKILETITSSELQNKPYTVWSGHQYIAGLEKLAGKVDLIALPQHVLNDSIKKLLHHSDTKLVGMVGVPHNITRASLVKSLEQWQVDSTLTKIPDLKNIIAVILGGDAPDEKGKQKFFTSKEASAFATYVANEALKTGATVLVTNGPRTGKFNPETGEECKVHQEEAEIDNTTKAFVTALKTKSVPYQLYNFTFGKASAYQAILAKVAANAGTAYVTGESTSMVSELLDVLSKDRLFIVQVGSQNSSHNAHVESVSRSSQVSVFNIDVSKATLMPHTFSSAVTDTPASTYTPAAEFVAKEIFLSLTTPKQTRVRASSHSKS